MQDIEVLRAATKAVAGQPDNEETRATLQAAGDWSQRYPVVDADGILTGEVVDADDGDYLTVNDYVVIAFDDLPNAVQERIEADRQEGIFDGYVDSYLTGPLSDVR